MTFFNKQSDRKDIKESSKEIDFWQIELIKISCLLKKVICHNQ